MNARTSNETMAYLLLEPSGKSAKPIGSWPDVQSTYSKGALPRAAAGGIDGKGWETNWHFGQSSQSSFIDSTQALTHPLTEDPDWGLILQHVQERGYIGFKIGGLELEIHPLAQHG